MEMQANRITPNFQVSFWVLPVAEHTEIYLDNIFGCHEVKSVFFLPLNLEHI